VPGSTEARQAARVGHGLVLNLEAPGEPKGGALVECARTGKRTVRTPARATATIAPSRRSADPEILDEDGHPLKSLRGLNDLAPGAGTGRQLALIAALAAAIVVLGGVVVWVARSGGPEIPVVAQNGPPRAAEPKPDVTAPPDEPAKPTEPKPEPIKEAPKPVAKAEPVPEPDPATAAVKETRTAWVKLPEASDTRSRHDAAPHVLEVSLPKAGRYALRLRGLDDPVMKEHELLARPTEPGRADTLKVGKDLSKGKVEQELARFWVETGRLHFQWAERLTRTLMEPADGLRDCVLEIKGGGVRLNVVLRPPVVDPDKLTAQGPRTIAWEQAGGHPGRPVVIQSCQVESEGKWSEIPEILDSTFLSAHLTANFREFRHRLQ
jgi:hypothetical protein